MRSAGAVSSSTSPTRAYSSHSWLPAASPTGCSRGNRGARPSGIWSGTKRGKSAARASGSSAATKASWRGSMASAPTGDAAGAGVVGGRVGTACGRPSSTPAPCGGAHSKSEGSTGTLYCTSITSPSLSNVSPSTLYCSCLRTKYVSLSTQITRRPFISGAEVEGQRLGPRSMT